MVVKIEKRQKILLKLQKFQNKKISLTQKIQIKIDDILHWAEQDRKKYKNNTKKLDKIVNEANKKVDKLNKYLNKKLTKWEAKMVKLRMTKDGLKPVEEALVAPAPLAPMPQPVVEEELFPEEMVQSVTPQQQQYAQFVQQQAQQMTQQPYIPPHEMAHAEPQRQYQYPMPQPVQRPQSIYQEPMQNQYQQPVLPPQPIGISLIMVGGIKIAVETNTIEYERVVDMIKDAINDGLVLEIDNKIISGHHILWVE